VRVVSIRDDIERDLKIAELEEALRRTERNLARSKAKTADLVQAVYQGAKDAALVAGSPKRVKASKTKAKPGAEVALLHLTDTHIGAVTATYNTDVAERRIMDTIAKTIKLAELQRKAHPVGECVVILGGDLIEQTAQFPHQAWAVDASTFEQVFDAARILEDAVSILADEFDMVTVYLTPGNHGRVGRGKGRQSLDYESDTNWDRIVGRIIGERLEHDERIRWVFPESWYSIVEVGAYRALAHHGDTIRSFGGSIPAYGIIKKHLAWASGVMPEFLDAYIGHFHTPMQLPMNNGGRVFVTPSLVSDSAYAKEFVAATSNPAQRLHFVDPERGRVTAEYLLHLD
jgi:hypothetical protein